MNIKLSIDWLEDKAEVFFFFFRAENKMLKKWTIGNKNTKTEDPSRYFNIQRKRKNGENEG